MNLRRINLFSIMGLLIVAVLMYLGYKFWPKITSMFKGVTQTQSNG